MKKLSLIERKGQGAPKQEALNYPKYEREIEKESGSTKGKYTFTAISTSCLGDTSTCTRNND